MIPTGQPRIFVYRPVLAIVITALLVVNLLTPFTGDVLVSFGSAFQADQLGDFPANVYQSWNLRGIGYKYVVYGLYRAADLFVDPGQFRSFEIVTKVIYYAIFLGLAYAFYRMIRPELAKLDQNGSQIFLLFLLAFFSNSNWLSLQAEELAVLFVFGAASFSLSGNKLLNHLSGVFLPLLLACKLITASFIAFPVLLLLYLGVNYKERLVRLIASLAGFSILTGLIYLFVIPQEIVDTVDAVQFQSSFRMSLSVIRRFFTSFAEAISHIPFLVTGFLFFAVVCLKKNYRDVTFLSVVFGAAALPVIIQATFHAYQYFSFSIFSLLCVALVLYRSPPALRASFFNLAFFLTAVLWVASVLVIRDEIPYKDPFANLFYHTTYEYEARRELYRLMDSSFHLSEEPEVLYLGNGIINYFIRSKSHLRYFYPLPVQRARSNPSLRKTMVYREQLAAMLAYQGRYIYLEPKWLVLSFEPQLEAKIKNEYEQVFSYRLPDENQPVVLFRRRD